MSFEKCACEYMVCPDCKGRGSSSAYLGAITADEMDELGDDFREDYRSGMYDRPCSTCQGNRVVKDHIEGCEERVERDYAAESEARYFAMMER